MTEPEDHELILPESGGWSTRADGLRMRFWRRGDRIVSEHTIPDTYHGPPGMAHGGIVATLFDEISCAAAARVFGWFVFTGELTVRYQHPSRSRRRSGGKRVSRAPRTRATSSS